MNISSLLRRLPGIVVLILALLPLHAQDTEIFIEDVTAAAGGELSVKVRGLGLESVVGMQFSISWDTLLLGYQSATKLDVNNAMTGFNESRLNSGYLGYLAVDNELNSLSIPDSAVIFTVFFESLSPQAATTKVAFDSIPVRISFSDAVGDVLESVVTPCTVTLETSSAVPAFAEDARFTVAPNPFSDFVRIKTNLAYSGRATLEILELSGRKISSRTLSQRAGIQTTELSAGDFPGEGAYIIRLVTDREQLHRKVVLHGRNR